MAATDTQRLDKEIRMLVRSVPANDSNRRTNRSITFQEFVSNKLLISRVIHKGVTYALFDLVKKTTPFSEPDWAGFLNVSTKSLQRYRQEPKSFRFRPLQSEKIIEIAEVTSVGEEVFGDKEKFRLWLETPNFALGNSTPKDLLKDSYGKELVLGELTRISHGILA